MKKYLLIIKFEWTDDIAELIPEHRAHINSLIETGKLEHYAVSMEQQTLWVTLNAESKVGAKKLLQPSPFYKYWKVDVTELIVWDGQNYRLPVVQLN